MIQLVLDEKFTGKRLSLSEIVKKFGFSCEDKNLEITIPENIEISIHDDLANIGIFKSTCVFILKRNSFLDYNFRAVEKLCKQKIYRKIEVTLEEEGAEARALCSCLGKDTQQYKLYTLQHHKASRTKSDFLIKGVFCDGSSMHCENLIRVEKGTQEVQATEKSKSLVLGNNSRVVTIPKLEIKSEDVSCFHGAVVSKLNDDHLFYFQSRGMNLKEAEGLLIKSFLR